jgi:hypothetical protein
LITVNIVSTNRLPQSLWGPNDNSRKNHQVPQLMLPVLDHLGLGFREFPDLVAQRGGFLTRQFTAASPAGSRLERDDVVALLGGQERALVPGVAGLTAPEASGPGLAPRQLGVGVFAAGWGRGVARRLVEPVLQLLDLGQKCADDGLRLRRLAGDQFFGEALGVAARRGELASSVSLMSRSRCIRGRGDCYSFTCCSFTLGTMDCFAPLR